jgi:hypothetical protein
MCAPPAAEDRLPSSVSPVTDGGKPAANPINADRRSDVAVCSDAAGGGFRRDRRDGGLPTVPMPAPVVRRLWTDAAVSGLHRAALAQLGTHCACTDTGAVEAAVAGFTVSGWFSGEGLTR